MHFPFLPILQRKPEIIVATPGRLWELMKIEDHLDAISHCDLLVIDETDRMIERGHFEELSSIIHHMNKVRGSNVDSFITLLICILPFSVLNYS